MNYVPEEDFTPEFLERLAVEYLTPAGLTKTPPCLRFTEAKP